MISIRVADSFQACATRERGREFLKMLESRIEAERDNEVLFSFEGVDFVSPSFLDEAVLTLMAQTPPKVTAVWLKDLSEPAVNSLRILIEASEAQVRLTNGSNGLMVTSKSS